jgi:hypothetical protein
MKILAYSFLACNIDTYNLDSGRSAQGSAMHTKPVGFKASEENLT